MLSKLKKISLTFSPKAFLLAVPAIVPFGIVEFLIFRISPSKTDCLCLPVVLSTKKEIYINFEDFTYTKLNSLTVLECRTNKLHYLVFKELSILYNKYFHFSSKNPLIIFGE